MKKNNFLVFAFFTSFFISCQQEIKKEVKDNTISPKNVQISTPCRICEIIDSLDRLGYNEFSLSATNPNLNREKLLDVRATKAKLNEELRELKSIYKKSDYVAYTDCIEEYDFNIVAEEKELISMYMAYGDLNFNPNESVSYVNCIVRDNDKYEVRLKGKSFLLNKDEYDDYNNRILNEEMKLFEYREEQRENLLPKFSNLTYTDLSPSDKHILDVYLTRLIDDSSFRNSIANDVTFQELKNNIQLAENSLLN